MGIRPPEFPSASVSFFQLSLKFRAAPIRAWQDFFKLVSATSNVRRLCLWNDRADSLTTPTRLPFKTTPPFRRRIRPRRSSQFPMFTLLEADHCRLPSSASAARPGAAGNALVARAAPMKLVAMADVFGARLNSRFDGLRGRCPAQVEVPEDRKFIGFDGYQKAMDPLKPGDIVILTSAACIPVSPFRVRDGEAG